MDIDVEVAAMITAALGAVAAGAKIGWSWMTGLVDRMIVESKSARSDFMAESKAARTDFLDGLRLLEQNCASERTKLLQLIAPRDGTP